MARTPEHQGWADHLSRPVTLLAALALAYLAGLATGWALHKVSQIGATPQALMLAGTRRRPYPAR